MAKRTCPIEGFKKFIIEYPDELKVKHQRIYANAASDYLNAQEKSGRKLEDIPMDEVRFYGAKALCTRFDNPPPETDLNEWPLAVYRWFMDAVYWDHYDKAFNPPKN